MQKKALRQECRRAFYILDLEGVPLEAMKRLGELFEALATVIQAGPNTEALLEIREPDDQWPFLQALRRTPQ